MKKKLGALGLALASLVISAACASSGYTPTPQDSGESYVQARPTELPDQHATETADQTARDAR
jgi:hypothetical protein